MKIERGVLGGLTRMRFLPILQGYRFIHGRFCHSLVERSWGNPLFVPSTWGDNTAKKYCQYIDEMHDKLKIVCPSLVNLHGPLLLHDNARPHTSHKTIAKLNELEYEVLQRPPYSPDLLPTDFHFFKHLELFLRGKHYENEDSLKNSISEFINSKHQNFLRLASML